MQQKHWLHPQTVPRGFLRLYILIQLSRESQTGYSIMQKIDERTEGAWKPGAGTMYPLLKGLQREGLVRGEKGEGRGSSKTYSLTTRGVREIEQIKGMMAGAGRKDMVMGRLFSELLPGALFVPMILRRYREGSEVLKQKFSEVPPDEKEALLSEFKLHIDSQMAWVDSQLALARDEKRSQRGKRAAQP
jgi:DNA-binding PadR family transcriptional regulator